METVVAERLPDQHGRFQPLVYWYLSLRCNLACKHCWVNSSPKVDTSTDLTSEEVLGLVPRIRELDPKLVILTGGEPLFRPDAQQLIQGLIDQQLNFSVETNGLLLNDVNVGLFQGAVDQGLFCWISVSLDGGTAESHEWVRGRGSFAMTLKGLRRLKQANVPFGVQCVINRKNLETIPQLFALGEELQLNVKDNVLAFVVTNPVGRAEAGGDELAVSFEDYDRAFQLIADQLTGFHGGVLIKVPPAAIPVRYLQRFMADPKVKFLVSCSFPLLGVLPDGKLSVCALTADEGALTLGHVRSDRLGDVVREHIEPLRAAYESATLTGVCGDCVFKASCKGACRAFAYSKFGSFLGPYPVCDSLAKAGRFPDVYRLSHRKALLERQLPVLAAAG